MQQAVRQPTFSRLESVQTGQAVWFAESRQGRPCFAVWMRVQRRVETGVKKGRMAAWTRNLHAERRTASNRSGEHCTASGNSASNRPRPQSLSRCSGPGYVPVHPKRGQQGCQLPDASRARSSCGPCVMPCSSSRPFRTAANGLRPRRKKRPHRPDPVTNYLPQ